ncbi:succinyl-diaminopimelate desuccinylase [Laceyella sacchari]|uniref:dipeptidase PepV n=1 Tax=Laceyella sacchari TaxID=37482 RepID=UPI0010491DEB|nr:dipeptidase PepV [Laceyella sacchari]TCW37976.1 succinyl-diaminopimelate desuccinylase [Laceyella sacchari]
MSEIRWLDEVEKRKEDLLKDLDGLLRIESVLDESTAGEKAPFGQKIAEALEYMMQLGEKDGFLTKNVDGYAGHIEYGEGEELIGLISHIDVVPAGEGWTSPPYEPEVRGGKLYARGAIDDKGPTMAAYYALKIVKELGLPLSKRVRLIIGTDEESKWRDMKAYFAREEMPTMGFSPDADFPIIASEKGLLDILLTGNGQEQPVDGDYWTLAEFKSGQRVNMVPDQAVVKLAGEGDVFELKEKVQDFLLTHRIQGYAEENNDGVSIVIQGQSHHGSEPHKGLNAALEMARLLGRVPLDPSGRNFVDMLNDLLVDGYFGEGLGIAQEEEVLGKLTVNAGVFEHVHNGRQSLRINVRYPLGGDAESILQTITDKMSAYGFTIDNVDHKPLHHVERNHPLIQTLAKVYEDQTGEKAEILAIGGGTFARALKTGVAFGPLFPGSEETAHQRDEHILLEDLWRSTAIYAQAIYELAR